MHQKVETSELRERLEDAGSLRAELQDLQHQLLEGSERERHLKGDLAGDPTLEYIKPLKGTHTAPFKGIPVRGSYCPL